MLKKALVIKFFKCDYYDRILRRINYYDLIVRSVNVAIQLPSESCFDKMYRNLIKREPPPYYSDYREIGTDVSELYDYLIYTIRMKYGYSRRITISTTSFTTSDDNSHEYYGNSNKSKNNMQVSIKSPNMLKLTLQKMSTATNQVLPSTNSSF